MEILRVSISRRLFPSLFDLIINHSKIDSFPQIVAHNFHFFKGFERLDLLDVLLRHKRGYNSGVGSRVRKVYFSDVDRILKESGETGIKCSESLKPSEAYSYSLKYKRCFCVLHEISEIDKIAIENLDEGSSSGPLLELSEGLKEIERNEEKEAEERAANSSKSKLKYGNLLTKASEGAIAWSSVLGLLNRIQEFGSVHPDKIFRPGEIDEILYLKGERDKEISELNQSLDSLMSIKELDVQETNKIWLNRASEGNIKNGEYMLYCCEKMEIFIRQLEVIKGMLDECEEKMSVFIKTRLKKDELLFRRSLEEYVSKKREIGFQFPKEIKGSLELDMHKFWSERLESLLKNKKSELEMDKVNLEVYEMSKEYSFAVKPALYIEKVSEARMKVKEFEKNKDKVSDFENVDLLLSPVSLRSLTYSLRDISPGLSVEVSNLIGGADVETFLKRLEVFKKEIIDFKDAFLKFEEDPVLSKKIKEVREKVKDHIINEINGLRTPKRQEVNLFYREISEERARMFRENDVISIDRMLMNEFEREDVEHIVDYLRQDEEGYLRIKRDRREGGQKAETFLSNVNFYSRKHKIPFDLEESEWLRVAMEREEESDTEFIKDFERALRDFEFYCGFSPYGIVIGGKSDLLSKKNGVIYRKEEEIKSLKKEKKEVVKAGVGRKEKGIEIRSIDSRIELAEQEIKRASSFIKKAKEVDKGYTEKSFESRKEDLFDEVLAGLSEIDLDCIKKPNYTFLNAVNKGIKYNPNLHYNSSRMEKDEVKSEQDKRRSVVMSKEIKKEKVYDMYINSNMSSCWPMGRVKPIEETNDEKGWIKVNSGINVKFGRKLEKELEIKSVLRKRSEEKTSRIIKEKLVFSKNIYEELEVEEAINDSNDIVDRIIESETSPYLCFNYRKNREYRKKKMNYIKRKKEKGSCGIDLIGKYNDFDRKNNSNSNKNYNVTDMIGYLKSLLAMRLLNLNTDKRIYKYYGLKRCQSKYAINQFVKLASKILSSTKDEFGFNFRRK